MKIFNTLTRQKEEFVPIAPGEAKIYACGPTVYNFIHIGNARPMIIFDTVRRYFEYKGYEVNYVSNFTDVDDKIIKKANEEGVTATEIAERYIKECKQDMEALNIKPATHQPRATEEIGGMIKMIQTLIKKGHAYEVDGTVYFKTRSFKDYGKLSKKNIDDLEAGHREIKVTGEEQANRLLRDLMNAGITVITFDLREPSLHEIFVEKVSEANKLAGITEEVAGGANE